MTTAAAQRPLLEARAVLRSLLRAVDANITAVAGNTVWRQHVLSEFRAQRGAAPEEAQRLLAVAAEYGGLVRDIAHHQVRVLACLFVLECMLVCARVCLSVCVTSDASGSVMLVSLKLLKKKPLADPV